MVSPNSSPKPTKQKKKKKMVKKPKESEKKYEAKKNGRMWTTQDEAGLLFGFVHYQASKALPKTLMTPVYDYIRQHNLLQHAYSNVQMKDKLRRLRAKYAGLKDKISAKNFTFKTPHEETLYNLSSQLWGSGEEVEEGVAEDDKKIKGQDVELPHKENEVEEGNVAAKQSKKRKKKKSKKIQKPSFVSDGEKIIELLQQENLAMMNAMKDDMTRENLEIKEMVREAVQRLVSNSVQFSSEEIGERIFSSSRELTTLEKAEAERLRHKWQRQHLIEVEAASKRLRLMQEECQLRMQKLRSLVQEKNS